MPKEPLKLVFHPNTIKHLGIALYSTLPPVIAELIANSYDANATIVDLYFEDKDGKKKITIKDNGEGMSYDDIRLRYLSIGRNRREENDPWKRIPIGKKGLGKLSAFGVSEKILIDTINKNIRNRIQLNYQDILKCESGNYEPKILIDNVRELINDGTTIIMEDLTRKSDFDEEYVKKIGYDLSKRFSIFNNDFLVTLYYNKKKIKQVTEDLKFNLIKNIEFKWNIPKDVAIENEYQNASKIIGTIYSTEKPIQKDMNGIYLLSRGKLVNQKEFFESRTDDYAYTYLTGWLSVDFIDDLKDDIISTNRESLNWEAPEAKELRIHLSSLMTHIKDDWREKRRNKTIEEIKSHSKIDLDNWIDSLSSIDKPIARKIINVILGSENIETEKSCALVSYVQASFEYQSFKNLAIEISKEENQKPDKLIKLLQDWEIIEAREIYNLSQVRIEAIKTLEKHIEDNALEVPTIHDFFAKFPWILDPRIMKFDDEVRYSKLLKDKFIEDESVIEKDRRIDFLCINHINQFFIIELKRPQSVITGKSLSQGLEYSSFLSKHLPNEYPDHSICCYVLGGSLSTKPAVQTLAKSLAASNNVKFLSYTHVLSQAVSYHKEFIDRYDAMKKDK